MKSKYEIDTNTTFYNGDSYHHQQTNEKIYYKNVSVHHIYSSLPRVCALRLNFT